jgi:hypothetical protein
MPARAEVSEFTRGYPRRFSGQTRTIPGSRTKGKRDHAMPMTPAIAAWFSRPKNPRHPDSPSTDFTPFLIAASTISCRDPRDCKARFGDAHRLPGYKVNAARQG